MTEVVFGMTNAIGQAFRLMKRRPTMLREVLLKGLSAHAFRATFASVPPTEFQTDERTHKGRKCEAYDEQDLEHIAKIGAFTWCLCRWR